MKKKITIMKESPHGLFKKKAITDRPCVSTAVDGRSLTSSKIRDQEIPDAP